MWKEYFDFSKSQRRAIYILLLLIMGIYAWRLYREANIAFPHRHYVEERAALQQFMRERDSLKRMESSSQVKKQNQITEQAPEYFNFNPNEATATDWARLGLKSYQISNILNFLKKGGSFSKPRDLFKMYTLDEEQVEALIPFVSIPESEEIKDTTALPKEFPFEEEKFNREAEYSPKQSILGDINRLPADSLMLLPGIGPVLSKRIEAYRNLLGGFYSMDQLYEVYGLDSPIVVEIGSRTTLDTSHLIPIDLNFEKRSVLAKHPYIDSLSLVQILEFRAHHGFIESVTILQEKAVIPDSIFVRIRPYLLPR